MTEIRHQSGSELANAPDMSVSPEQQPIPLTNQLAELRDQLDQIGGSIPPVELVIRGQELLGQAKEFEAGGEVMGVIGPKDENIDLSLYQTIKQATSEETWFDPDAFDANTRIKAANTYRDLDQPEDRKAFNNYKRIFPSGTSKGDAFVKFKNEATRKLAVTEAATRYHHAVHEGSSPEEALSEAREIERQGLNDFRQGDNPHKSGRRKRAGRKETAEVAAQADEDTTAAETEQPQASPTRRGRRATGNQTETASVQAEEPTEQVTEQPAEQEPGIELETPAITITPTHSRRGRGVKTGVINVKQAEAPQVPAVDPEAAAREHIVDAQSQQGPAYSGDPDHGRARRRVINAGIVSAEAVAASEAQAEEASHEKVVEMTALPAVPAPSDAYLARKRAAQSAPTLTPGRNPYGTGNTAAVQRQGTPVAVVAPTPVQAPNAAPDIVPTQEFSMGDKLRLKWINGKELLRSRMTPERMRKSKVGFMVLKAAGLSVAIVGTLKGVDTSGLNEYLNEAVDKIDEVTNGALEALGTNEIGATDLAPPELEKEIMAAGDTVSGHVVADMREDGIVLNGSEAYKPYVEQALTLNNETWESAHNIQIGREIFMPDWTPDSIQPVATTELNAFGELVEKVKGMEGDEAAMALGGIGLIHWANKKNKSNKKQKRR